MGSGDLIHRVVLQRVDRTANVMNEQEETGVDLGTRWALVEGQTGREVQRANQTAPTATHKVTLRADTLTKALTTDKRLVWRGPGGNVTLGIVHVDLSKTRDGWVFCLCEAAA